MTWLRAQWDRVLGFTLIGLGGLALILGFRGVSNAKYVADQLSYIISGGLGGLYLLGCGALLVLVAEIRDEWRKLDGIEAALRGEVAPDSEPTASANGSADAGRRRAAPKDEALPKAFAPLTAVSLTGALVVLVVASFAAAGESDVDPAIRTTAWAVAGLVAAGSVVGGSTLWAERRVRLRQSRFFTPLLLQQAMGSESLTEPVGSPPSTVVAAPGLTRYHRRGCAAVERLAVDEFDIGEVPDHLRPCRLCL